MNEVERIFINKWRKKKLKNKSFISKKINNLKNYFKKLFSRQKNNIGNVSFSGWGMTTTFSKPPWRNSKSRSDQNFNDFHDELCQLIYKKEFFLSQFYLPDTNYDKILQELKWRSYIIYNSALLALNFAKAKKHNIVECGVCDGLTVFFALKAYESKKVDFKGFLYDSFDKMKEEHLDSKDKDQLGNYDYLNIEQTKKNLQMFEKEIIFFKGYIPNVFQNGDHPKDVSWLHIDLNSSQTTLETMEFFYSKIVDNGIIIFDDYGMFDTTKEVVDNFLKDKNGHFMSYPTGQGMFIKKLS
tara:strand:- start:1472 stop:2365 length:894 start_codon:yes stop_codon:yes gene_type:complete